MQVITEAIARSRVLLVIIGPQWLAAEANGCRRLDRPDDPVRVELETALRRGLRVIPLLLDGAAEEFPRLRHLWADQGYTGTGKAWIELELGWTVEIVQHPPKPRGVWAPAGAVIDWETLRPKGFRGVLPRRWVVERSFGWLGQSRRLSKDLQEA